MLYHFVDFGKTGNNTKLSTILKIVFDKRHILMAQSSAVAIQGDATNLQKEVFDGYTGSS